MRAEGYEQTMDYEANAAWKETRYALGNVKLVQKNLELRSKLTPNPGQE
jgi:hypothetical protein